MANVRTSWGDRWRRRYWRPDQDALRAEAHLQPLTLITGASEGIGRAIAQLLAPKGQRLLLIARDATRLETVAAHLRDAHRAHVDILAIDLTRVDAPSQIDKKLAELGAYVETVINNAGVGLAGAFDQLDTAALDALVQLNVAATARIMRHTLPGMLRRGHGGILTIASLAAFAPGPWQAAYFASKAFQVSLSEALAVETAGKGVTITCVTPGPVETAFHTKMGTNRALYRLLFPAKSPEQIAALALMAYRWRMRTFVPGLLPGLGFLALKALPHRLSAPVLGALMRPRHVA